ncbi:MULTISPECIES: hypothetical protein [unclassified Streptomyces]|uniref:hypothetical protein n=1 Tax=unclassified Streptomyces TaxID=2593676 RepID=UPI0011CD99CF|nr:MULTISPECIES: hypothetical protein [unclassified Streptomyces]
MREILSTPAVESVETDASWDLSFADGGMLPRVVEELCTRGMVAPGGTTPPDLREWAGDTALS